MLNTAFVLLRFLAVEDRPFPQQWLVREWSSPLVNLDATLLARPTAPQPLSQGCWGAPQRKRFSAMGANSRYAEWNPPSSALADSVADNWNHHDAENSEYSQA
jgi:hypothetical protein